MSPDRPVAFVFAGGSVLAACEIGMLAALAEVGIRPDIVLGSSAGAALGAVFAAAERARAVAVPYAFWNDFLQSPPFAWTIPRTVYRMLSPAARLQARAALLALLDKHLPAERFEDLPVRFECNALQLPTLQERWFHSGSLREGLLAATAGPGILPHASVGGDRYIDGGVRNPVPIDRALEMGARTIYVLQISDFERPWRLPDAVWQTGPFEAALRYRLAKLLGHLPPGVEVHMLPLGRRDVPHGLNLLRKLYGIDLKHEMRKSEEHIQEAYRATAAYLRFESIAGKAQRKCTGGRPEAPPA
ncbi:patatin-like phospholipase family protein [Spirillospora sp. NPDC127200]